MFIEGFITWQGCFHQELFGHKFASATATYNSSLLFLGPIGPLVVALSVCMQLHRNTIEFDSDSTQP